MTEFDIVDSNLYQSLIQEPWLVLAAWGQLLDGDSLSEPQKQLMVQYILKAFDLSRKNHPDSNWDAWCFDWYSQGIKPYIPTFKSLVRYAENLTQEWKRKPTSLAAKN